MAMKQIPAYCNEKLWCVVIRIASPEIVKDIPKAINGERSLTLSDSHATMSVSTLEDGESVFAYREMSGLGTG